jgi:ATP-dependent RNA helicase DeaD
MIDRLLDQGYASTDICSALIHLLQGGGGGAGAGGPPAESKVPGNAPAWVKKRAAAPGPLPAPSEPPRARPESVGEDSQESASPAPSKQKYEPPARTGREPGFTTIFLNIGRKQLVTPADIVGKIAGVTRLPANVVGAIDIHQRHTLADVAEEHALAVIQKLGGIKLKGIALAPTLAQPDTPS